MNMISDWFKRTFSDPQVVVLMTDGYTPWPDAPTPYPLITLTTGKHCPFGENIEV